MRQQVLAETVRVAIHASEDLTRAGLASCLQRERRLSQVATVREADVTVVAADVADGATLDLLRRLSDEGEGADTSFVMVVGRRWHADVSAAIDRGVRAVLWRDAFTPADFARTLFTVAQGGGSLPPSLQGTLMEQVQVTQREVLVPRGLTASGISPREVDVLRLIAEGAELADIAAKLCYSERTVKYVLYGLMKRLQLRNRAHAVSYAIRAGLI
ncbi:helix-turn-helix transcriptional regulator [Streptantibioticus ferralitis]|uniref:Response regulator transcription factor n=1 Tax=Streptantibioticus ferralitis TaxID=236510 RepID=A0ABT5Z539_9ACTN|nr:response regulator transcription factor [Streptantibioticus ferralitis]MDF2258782.1 response regulator transcription factor [Streptantibioticus ferralitis]